jgi:hypothetical protein
MKTILERARSTAGKMSVFGLKKRGDQAYTQVVKNCSAAALASQDSVIYSDGRQIHDGLVNVGHPL